MERRKAKEDDHCKTTTTIVTTTTNLSSASDAALGGVRRQDVLLFVLIFLTISSCSLSHLEALRVSASDSSTIMLVRNNNNEPHTRSTNKEEEEEEAVTTNNMTTTFLVRRNTTTMEKKNHKTTKRQTLSNITFLVTTAPSPIHPKTCGLEETISTLPYRDNNIPLVIAFDSCIPKPDEENTTRCQRYQEYKQRLRKLYYYRDREDGNKDGPQQQHAGADGGSGVSLVETPVTLKGRKLSKVLAYSLAKKSIIRTEFVAIIQDDMPFTIPNLDWESIAQDMTIHQNLTLPISVLVYQIVEITILILILKLRDMQKW